MPKGVRQETTERMELAHANRPYSLGPLVGLMALKINLSLTTISNIVGVHDQTVFRWVFGQSEITPPYLPKVSKLVMILSWMIVSKRGPLVGTVLERQRQFVQHTNDFKQQSASAQ